MSETFVHSLREAAPYIHYLRGKTIVVGIASSLLLGDAFRALAADLNLLTALGVRLILVHGVETQVSQLCKNNQIVNKFYQQHRVCDDAVLQLTKQACGALQFDIQTALSFGLAHAPQKMSRVQVATGNFVSAKPLGVVDGVDMGFAGAVRKVDAVAINRALDEGAVVLLSPLGASASGQGYCLTMLETAQAVANAVQAEKLMFVLEQWGVMLNDELLPEIHANEAQQLLNDGLLDESQTRVLQTALTALQNGISRVQVLSGRANGALIQELFTRHGAGTSIAQAPFTSIRPATERDIADLLAMTRPLEAKGVLMPRGQEYFAEHIHDFFVLENDRQIYGCVALKSFMSAPDVGELACLVVSSHAREGGYGEQLLAYVIRVAQQMGKKRLLALSTQTSDWFRERGFQAAFFDDLPLERQQEYIVHARQSHIFMKAI